MDTRKTDVMKAGKSPKRARTTSPPDEGIAAAQEPDQQPASPGDKPARQAVVLLPECTARNAESLKADLLALVKVEGQVEIEVGAVERVDTVCLQLLTAFVKERTQHGRVTAWLGHNDVLGQAAALLGLGGTLVISGAA